MKNRLKVHLMVIDPQIDFSWPGLGYFMDLSSPGWKVVEPLLRAALGPMLDDVINPGKLYVPGAWEAMLRLAAMIRRLGVSINDITVTFDAHQIVDQAHPIWWREVLTGKRPNPFTILGLVGNTIQSLDPTAGMRGTGVEYTTYLPSMLDTGGVTGKGSRGYLAALESRGKQPHVVWPVHSEIGTWGSTVVPELMAALQAWQENFALVNYVTKGSNPYTEHYGAIEAEVPDPLLESTQVQMDVVDAAEKADIIAWAGIASTHCLAETLRGMARNFKNSKAIEKMVLLTDATAPVPGFEFQYEALLQEMQPKGLRTDTTVNFLT